MLINKKGDILSATENIICHQVNCQGVMGGGLARQLSNKYNSLEDWYKWNCDFYNCDYYNLKGKVLYYVVDKNKIVANCFSQKPNFDTDYDAVKECFKKVKESAMIHNMNICTVKNYGCGIANGSWEKVVEILESIFTDVDLVIYELESGEQK
jgi:O-acetyl-ADP-ribose deacetylase (regulator of RNase III)